MRKMGRTTKPRIKPQKRFGHGSVKNRALIKKDLGNFSSFWGFWAPWGRFWPFLAPGDRIFGSEADFWLWGGFLALRRISTPKHPDSTLQNPWLLTLRGKGFWLIFDRFLAIFGIFSDFSGFPLSPKSRYSCTFWKGHFDWFSTCFRQNPDFYEIPGLPN